MENAVIIRHPLQGFYRAPRLNILVLDENEFERNRLKRMLIKADPSFEVVPCQNIIEFEAALAEHPIDICLVDPQLEQASGLDAAAKIKDVTALPDLPVIMVSGREDIETVVQSIKAGCADYLGKQTLTPEKLHRKIFDAISFSFTNPALSNEVKRATGDVMNGVASQCSKELKPKLNRMYRQIGFIRSCHTHGLLPSPEALDDIEKQCLAIWRFFDELVSYSSELKETRH